MRYLIDSSSLMELENRYPQHIFNKLWDFIFDLFDRKMLFSVREVYEELKDSQEIWAEYEDCFVELSKEEYEYLDFIISSKKFKVFQYWGIEKNNEEHWAGPHLVAYALNNKDVCIISEESSRNHPKRKINYVCHELDIRCIKLLDFIEELNIQL